MVYQKAKELEKRKAKEDRATEYYKREAELEDRVAK